MSLTSVGSSQTFSYTGGIQSLAITKSGIYQLECYGAGTSYSITVTLTTGRKTESVSAKGGYTKGYAKLYAGSTLYIGVGGGSSRLGSGGYNGGGVADGKSTDSTYMDAWTTNGGGATHIALNSNRGVLSSYTNNRGELLLVAGGAGGCFIGHDASNTQLRGVAGGAGGSGGGASFGQGAGSSAYVNSNGVLVNFAAGGGGGYAGGSNVKASGSSYNTSANGGTSYTSGCPSFIYNGATYSPTATAGGAGTGNGSAKVTLIALAYTVAVNNSTGGSTSGTGTYFSGETASLSFTPNYGYKFDGLYSDSGYTTLITTSSSYSFNVSGNVTYYAKFSPLYNISIDYDSNSGSATYTWISRTSIRLTASPRSGFQFLGWYVNSVLISSSTPATYEPLGDTVINAVFEPIYTVTQTITGNGALDITRGTDQNDVTFNVIPNRGFYFSEYIIDGETSETVTPLRLHLTKNISLEVIFLEYDKMHISVSTNFDYGSIYVSHNDDYPTYTAALWARPFPGYTFVGWSDGVTTNPRTINVSNNITLVANYRRASEENGIYQYRCYVKDQMNMTDWPKCFMKVTEAFNIKTDLLTNANSSITVMDLPEGINEGDVLVLYDPKGITIYQGVIKSISGNTISCSQMQSFYKGTWIYNVHPSNSLEQEISWLLTRYSNGYIYKSSYRDTWVSQRLSGITPRYTASTSVKLPTDLDEDGNEQLTEMDMEKWIYELYEKYGIVFRFTINVYGANYVDIEVPSYSTIKVGNNMFAIQNMSPVTSIEETNRLIIFKQDKTYRTTYVATKNGIVENPSNNQNRFNITNTVIVYSDDDAADLVAANLPQQMYNHKLSFTLILKNFIFEFDDFKLGGSLDVWKDDDYYNTVLTGYELRKEANKNIVSVDFVCGKVRTALTKKLTLKGGL